MSLVNYEPYEPRGLILWRLKKLGANSVWVVVLGIEALVIASSIIIYFWE